MNVATHILLATDFSESAEPAISKAADLARLLDAKLTVLNVHGHPPGPPEANVAPEKLLWSSDLDAESLEHLDELKKTRLAGIQWVALATAEDANPAHSICEYAKMHDIDLIVVGTHGRGGVAHFFFGSVAEKVLRRAVCPVLVVPDIRVLAAC